jgi:choline-sulfatase
LRLEKGSALASRDPQRPNILFILSDDQGCWALGCAGNNEIHTPHLDGLAAGGIRLDRLFCVSPVCSPARASILTGRIPSQHGIHDWLRAGNSSVEKERGGRLIEYLRGQTAYTDLLSAHGYTCGLSGKWHLGDAPHPQKGFTFWKVHAKGGGPYYRAPMLRGEEVHEEPRYVTDVITENALHFLEAQAATPEPFYLSVHYTAPHSPWEREQHPAEIYDEYHAHCPFQSVPDEPIHPWQINSAPYPRNAQERRAILSGYYAAVTAMDRSIGRLLEWLDRHGLREQTLVVFTGDNGMNMGHHGIYGKGNGTFPLNLYDTSVLVPAIVARPGHVPAGHVSHALLSHYDLRPTLLEYAGIADPEHATLPGSSFAPLLRGEHFDGRPDVVVFDEYGPVRMVRTREWKYVHRYPYGPHELYDLMDDPGEKADLFGQPETAARVHELRARLERFFAQYVDPKLDGAREGVTGKGQLGLVGPAAHGEEPFATDWHYLSPPPKA